MSKLLSIDLIITDAGTQMRAGTRLETVKEYEQLFNGKKWPFDDPLVVFTDGKSYWLADGFHRFEAAQLANRGSVLCDVKKGSLEKAQDFALGANLRHGLRRSNDDKRHSVRTALGMKRWAECSDRLVAEACGVGHPLVAKIRKEIQLESDSSSNSANPVKTGVKRKGKDGKKRSTPSKAKPTTHQREPGDESEPDGEDPVVEAPKADWKLARSKAMKTAQALQRAIDDLNELKRNYPTHEESMKLTQDVEALIKGWK